MGYFNFFFEVYIKKNMSDDNKEMTEEEKKAAADKKAAEEFKLEDADFDDAMRNEFKENEMVEIQGELPKKFADWKGLKVHIIERYMMKSKKPVEAGAEPIMVWSGEWTVEKSRNCLYNCSPSYARFKAENLRKLSDRPDYPGKGWTCF